MELMRFEVMLSNNNAINLDGENLLFRDYELFNIKTQESKTFDNLEQVYDYKLNGKTIREIVQEAKEFTITLDGSRGSSSQKTNTKMGGGFNHAPRNRGRKAEDYGATQFPARLNSTSGNRYKSYEATLKQFEKMYKNAEIEYGASIDEQGFATRLIKGGSTSVPISGAKGEMLLHNHPSGGNFSDSDLIAVASGSEKGIVAVGSNVKKDRMRYTFTKNKNFKAKEFIKAVSKAKWPSNLSYDKGADWWLRKNAKTYGYKYSAVKIKN